MSHKNISAAPKRSGRAYRFSGLFNRQRTMAMRMRSQRQQTSQHSHSSTGSTALMLTSASLPERTGTSERTVTYRELDCIKESWLRYAGSELQIQIDSTILLRKMLGKFRTDCDDRFASITALKSILFHFKNVS